MATGTEARPYRRGTYAKGRATKDNILKTALSVIGRKGYSATYLRDIAEEVGITQAGLLHHFENKENLLAEVLRKRDDINREQYSPSDLREPPLVIQLAHHNINEPGLIQLYVSLAAAAADPEHPCHQYFLDRDAFVVSRIQRDVELRQEAGLFDPTVDGAVVARTLFALSDGLQAQWVVNPAIDLPGTLDAYWNQFVLAAPSVVQNAEG